MTKHSLKRKYCRNNMSKKILTIINTKIDLVQDTLNTLVKKSENEVSVSPPETYQSELANSKESELVKLYSTRFKQTMNLNQSWRQSQSKLDKNDVSIEFSYYGSSKKNKSTDSILYVAYIFKKDWEYPKMIPLFEEKQLKSILSKQLSWPETEIITWQYFFTTTTTWTHSSALE